MVFGLRVYYETNTRAAGFRMGAMLAMVWSPWQESPAASQRILEILGWEYYINQKFVKDAARRPQAELIDWYALAQHEQGWFIKDQTHLSYEGSKAYVAAIKKQTELEK